MKRKISKRSFTLQFMSWEISMLFYILSFLGIISHALDILTLNDDNPTILLQNIPVIILLSINAILGYFKWISKSLALNVLIYSLVISIMAGFVFFAVNNPNLEIVFIRNNLFISLLMVIATLFNGKHHLYIISVIFWAGTFSVVSFFSNSFLENYGILIFIVYFSFAFLVYHFYDILENILKQKEKDA
ncbi:MAG: hypothetical protein MI922_00735, partial [Bacteroidales bacterium]|nr:hypothetical protein [Bacteroidales bacterium]